MALCRSIKEKSEADKLTEWSDAGVSFAGGGITRKLPCWVPPAIRARSFVTDHPAPLRHSHCSPWPPPPASGWLPMLRIRDVSMDVYCVSLVGLLFDWRNWDEDLCSVASPSRILLAGAVLLPLSRRQTPFVFFTTTSHPRHGPQRDGHFYRQRMGFFVSVVVAGGSDVYRFVAQPHQSVPTHADVSQTIVLWIV